MKLLSIAPLILAATSTYASSLTHGYDVVHARQAKVHRDLLDVCVSLDADLILNDIIQNGVPLVAGHLDICLCVSLIPDFIKVNVVAQTAVNLLGVAKVTALIEALINDQPGCQHCSFPEHAQSVCSPDWPCEFNCQDGYSPYTKPGDAHPSSCTCPPPMSECNGKCGSYPNGCGSAVPAPPQRRSRHTKRQVEGKSLCSAEQQVCGVDTGKGWECVNTKTDKESCGGCTTPSPFGEYHPAAGVDCTAIPNVDPDSVECQSSICHVNSCKTGFQPSATNDSCVPISVPAPPSTSAVRRSPMFNLGPGVEAVAGNATPRAVEARADVADAHVIVAAKVDIRNVADNSA